MPVPNGLKLLGVLALLGAGGYATARAISSTSPQGPPADSTGGPRLPSPVPTTPGTKFPLVMGMKGNALVKQLQQAILSKGGPGALEIQNSGGADGSFGPGTSRALAAMGQQQTTTVTEATFNQIVYGQATSSTVPGLPAPSSTPPPRSIQPNQVTVTNVNKLQSDLKMAVHTLDPAGVLKVLHQLKTPADYNAVNDNGDGLHFYDSLLTNQTIVTKVLSMWPGDPRFEAAFSMMGLVKQGGKWQVPAMTTVAGLGTVALVPASSSMSQHAGFSLPTSTNTERW